MWPKRLPSGAFNGVRLRVEVFLERRSIHIDLDDKRGDLTSTLIGGQRIYTRAIVFD